MNKGLFRMTIILIIIGYMSLKTRRLHKLKKDGIMNWSGKCIVFVYYLFWIRVFSFLPLNTSWTSFSDCDCQGSKRDWHLFFDSSKCLTYCVRCTHRVLNICCARLFAIFNMCFVHYFWDCREYCSSVAGTLKCYLDFRFNR